MPTEMSDVETFVKLSEKADSCTVKRSEDSVKIKLKMPNRLYTLKVEKEKVDALIKRLKCKPTEVGKT
jgi:hypothetical protein